MKFLDLLLGGIEPMMFLVFIIYAYLGLVLSIVVDVIKRKPESPKSPVKFSLKYLWTDNKERIIVSVILIPVLVVIFSFFTGKEINLANAFLIGWAGDEISNILKRKWYGKKD